MKECARCSACFEDAESRCPHDGSELEASLPGPTRIDGKYQLLRRLGQGGMGVVFRARHLGLQRDLALKVLRSSEAWDEKAFARFRLEAEALGRLDHPCIVNVTDFGVDPRGKGLPYLVTEVLDGQPLSERIARDGLIPLDEALALLEPIVAAVDFAHSRGVLHRDLKPHNVFVCRGTGSTASLKLLDFGLARFGEWTRSGRGVPLPAARPPKTVGADDDTGDLPTLEGSLETLSTPLARPSDPGPTDQGSIAGTPLYMAPERFTEAASTAATDIYALGVLAYQLVVGQPPFGGDLRALMDQHVRATPPAPSARRPDLPSEMDEPLLAPLAKDPALRPRSGAAFLHALRAAERAARVRAWRAAELPLRLGLAAALTVALPLVAPAVERWGAVGGLERRLVDARFAIARPTAPDPRLTLLVLDEASLDGMPAALGDARTAEVVASGLEDAFAAGALGVAIDALLPAAWSRAPGFSRFVLRHADGLTLAAQVSPGSDAVGPEVLQGLTAAALGPESVRRLFGFVNVETDPDGVVRRVRARTPGAQGGPLAAWAVRAASTLPGRTTAQPAADARDPGTTSPFWIDYTVDSDRFPTIAWKDLTRVISAEPARLRGKLVLFAFDPAASGDRHRVPAWHRGSREWPGIVLQAVVTQTVLSGFPVRRHGAGQWVLALAAAVAFAGVLCAPRWAPFLALGVAAAVAYVVVAFAIFRETRLLLPLATPLVLLGAGLLATTVARLRLAPFPR
jgi:serine/threonine-protein kinase